MNDIILLSMGILSGILITWAIMIGRIEDAKASARQWRRIAISAKKASYDNR